MQSNSTVETCTDRAGCCTVIRVTDLLPVEDQDLVAGLGLAYTQLYIIIMLD